MDESRITANQRHDLIDRVRMNTSLQDAFGRIVNRLFGNPESFTAAARDTLERPMLLDNFAFSLPGGMQIQVDQTYVVGADNHEACVYDTDGNCLTGTNAVTPKIYVVPNPIPGPGVSRYLIARRAATDSTNEGRKFYTASSGETTANTNTQTFDDWEISEPQAEGEPALDSASGNVNLRDAGWIDVAVFQTDGAANITLVGAVNPLPLAVSPLTWAVGPPDADRAPLNITEWIGAIAQILGYLRAGALGNREWWYDPVDDACFEEGGGLRFNDGAGTLQNAFIRLIGAALDQITATPNAPANADDLLHLRGRAVYAGDATGDPDVTAGSGFIYTDDPDGPSNPYEVQKFYSVDASGMFPGNGVANVDPWSSLGVGTLNNWYLSSVIGAAGEQTRGLAPWDTNLGWGIVAQFAAPVNPGFPGLYIPLSMLPSGSRLDNVELRLSTSGMNAAHFLNLFIVRRAFDFTAGTVQVLNAGGAPVPTTFPVAGNQTIVEAVALGGGLEFVDTSTYAYYAVVLPSATGAFGPSDKLRITDARAQVTIREASHVY